MEDAANLEVRYTTRLLITIYPWLKKITISDVNVEAIFPDLGHFSDTPSLH